MPSKKGAASARRRPVKASEVPAEAPAVELTDQDRADAAFTLELGIKAAAVQVHASWWTLSQLLYAFHEGGYWSDIGYDTLDEFLAQPELGISRSQFFQMTRTWRDLVVVRNVEPKELEAVEPSKAKEVLPAIRRGDVEVEDALDDAKGLGARDLREKYRPQRQHKHKQAPDDSTVLEADDEPVRVQCEVCGQWRVVDDDEQEVDE